MNGWGLAQVDILALGGTCVGRTQVFERDLGLET